MSDAPEWVNPDLKAVLVAEYFWKIPIKTTIKRGSLSRQREETKIRYAVLTSKEVLEEQDWNGRYSPLVPVSGTEL